MRCSAGRAHTRITDIHFCLSGLRFSCGTRRTPRSRCRQRSRADRVGGPSYLLKKRRCSALGARAYLPRVSPRLGMCKGTAIVGGISVYVRWRCNYFILRGRGVPISVSVSLCVCRCLFVCVDASNKSILIGAMMLTPWAQATGRLLHLAHNEYSRHCRRLSHSPHLSLLYRLP